jgi:predicted nuclease of predicted toxin-antitoxin system
VREPLPSVRLYLDEDVSVLLAELLRPHGFDVVTTRDVKRLGESDSTQLQFAADHQRTILTHNRLDFEALHTVSLQENRPHAGILIANRRASDFELMRRVLKLLDGMTAEDMRTSSATSSGGVYSSSKTFGKSVRLRQPSFVTSTMSSMRTAPRPG